MRRARRQVRDESRPAAVRSGRLGVDRLAPADGAFYIYADVSHLTDDTGRYCYRLLDDTGVAAAPGVDFDPVDGHRFLRMSFAGSTETITGALAALRRYWGTKG